MKLIAAVLMLFMIGCASLNPDLAKPKVDLTNVDLKNASFTDATLIFNFQVQNPNQVALNLDRINYALKVDGRPFTKGVLEQGVKVAGNSSVIVPVPVPIKYSDLSQGLTTLFGRGTTPYEIQGDVQIGFLTVPFNQTGELKLSDLKK